MFLFRLHQRIIYIVILTQVYFRMHLNVKSNVILSFHTLCSMFSQENLLYMIVVISESRNFSTYDVNMHFIS